MPVSKSDTVVATSAQMSCSIGQETVILQVERGEYFGLNEVGASIWKIIQQPQKVANIHAALLNEYDVAPDDCERDLLRILGELEAAGLVEVSGAAAAP